MSHCWRQKSGRLTANVHTSALEQFRHAEFSPDCCSTEPLGYHMHLGFAIFIVSAKDYGSTSIWGFVFWIHPFLFKQSAFFTPILVYCIIFATATTELSTIKKSSICGPDPECSYDLGSRSNCLTFRISEQKECFDLELRILTIIAEST